MGIELSLETTNLAELGKQIAQVFADKTQRSGIIAEAMKKAIAPVESRLRSLTPVGPTGNLKAAVNSKVVRYASGNAVGVVGYNRAGKGPSSSAAGGRVRRGPDRAFHQFWLEDGTKDRVINKFSSESYVRKSHVRRTRSGTTTTVKSHDVSGQNAYIASSFNRLGPFKMLPTPRPPRGEDGQAVRTDPGYPGAFFKKSSQPITIDGMTPGGRAGRPPLATAWAETETTVAEILQRELRLALEAELAKIARAAA
jgi:hypothetical protein